MKCKNGHDFEFPAYMIQQFVQTPGPASSPSGTRSNYAYPVCPICQQPLFEAPKPSHVRRKKKKKSESPPTEEVEEGEKNRNS